MNRVTIDDVNVSGVIIMLDSVHNIFIIQQWE